MILNYILFLFLSLIPINTLAIVTPNKVSSSGSVPNIYKRDLMNKILLSSLGTSCGPLLFGFLNVFSPRNKKSNTDGVFVRDKLGNEVLEKEWITYNPYPSRNLVEGLKGDAYYLISKKDNTIESFALNAVCTHLGCVVPWNPSENKFMCPCHGSQYNEQGKVIRGPAPKSLALAKVTLNENKVILTEWTDSDFRTNEAPWWV